MPSSRTFRVFISSTFKDLELERNYLQNEIFPKLELICKAYGATFQFVDLRWGVSEEASVDQRALSICLDEIKRCQLISPKPNFVVLLGERYGWSPPPPVIPEWEWDALFPYLSHDEQALSSFWYKCDYNAVEANADNKNEGVYVLQPRREGEYEVYRTYTVWVPVEMALHDALLAAAYAANLPRNSLVKYFASATHQEILSGAFAAENAASHVHCFFRQILKIPVNADSADYFEANINQSQLLQSLKKELRDFLPETNLHEYKLDLLDPLNLKPYLERLGADVFEALKGVILTELAREEQKTELESEVTTHATFADQRATVFVGRGDLLDAIKDYTSNDDNLPLVLCGAPGAGKSALVAKAVAILQEQGKKKESFVRFIGITPNSSGIFPLLRSVLAEISSVVRRDIPPFPERYDDLIQYFGNQLAFFSSMKVVIFLDALDQLSKEDPGRDLRWIPKNLPRGTKLIVTYASDANDIDLIARSRFTGSLHIIKGLSLDEGKNALATLLTGARRTLQPHQWDELISKFQASGGLPLYLKLAFEAACTWHSYDPPENTTLALTTEDLIYQFFTRLQRTHDSRVENIDPITKVSTTYQTEIVTFSLGYILASRRGLTESEILDLLSYDRTFFGPFGQSLHHQLPAQRLPPVVWARLFADLKPYLATRGVDHTTVLTFFHRQFSAKSFCMDNRMDYFHTQLAAYFGSQDLDYNAEGVRKSNYRKLSELPYQRYKASQWALAAGLLTNLPFVDAKVAAEELEDLIADYNRLIYSSDFQKWTATLVDHARKGAVDAFRGFLMMNSHIFRRNPRLTFQQAINEPDTSMLARAARKMISSGQNPSIWCEWINKPIITDPCILTLMGHADYIRACAWSPDGTRLASASSDRTLKIWDSITGMCLRTLEGHKDVVWACTWSPDGTRIASASSDRTLKIWDITSSVCLRSIEHSKEVRACAWSPNGSILASASKDGTVKLWDVATGVCQRNLEAHPEGVDACAWSPDGTRIASGGGYKDISVKIWDAATGAYLLTLKGHRINVGDLVWSRDGTRIATAGDNTSRIWDTKTGACLHILSGHSRNVWGCAWSPDGFRIASASFDLTLKIWDTSTGICVCTLNGHSGWVVKCAWSPDGTTLASASNDKMLKLWSPTICGISSAEKGHTGSILACALSPDGAILASASDDNTVKLWDATTGICHRTLAGHTFRVEDCVWAPDGHFLASASADGTIKIWNPATGECVHTLGNLGHRVGWDKPNRGYTPGIGWSPDGAIITSGSRDATLKLWNRDTGECLLMLDVEPDFTPRLGGWDPQFAWSPCGHLIASVSKTLKIWNIENGTCQHTILGTRSPISWFPGGKTIATSSSDRKVKLWDVATGACLRTLDDMVTSWALSTDGSRLATASDDHKLKIWDTATGSCLRVIEGVIPPWSFSPRGNRLVSDSSDHIMKLWDIDTGECLRSWKGECLCSSSRLDMVRMDLSANTLGWIWSTDGKQFVSRSDDSTVKLWDATSGNALGEFHSRGAVTRVTIINYKRLVIGDAAGGIYFIRSRCSPH